ncbi:hypothetical protein [Clostridium aciditolerans]|uniref:Uncharacterized protein n=1 Tax=Clostridium aciditolerans TaxID=339861 RepID=A0A934HVS2_9CLOT|nr:hypothetical protein [Clostridium aciditolerans]MBI6871807.1 hypothetical protein [Clostridium aciditolerans]
MEAGSGGRKNPYFRVSINGKGSLTPEGRLSNDKALIHIDFSDNYIEPIDNMIKIFKGSE